MRSFLARSNNSLNANKLNGLLAEVDFKQYPESLGFGERVSRDSWIVRRVGVGEFAHSTAVFFPETILPDTEYSVTRPLPQPDHGLHTICSTFHQTGIDAYFCAGITESPNDYSSLHWKAIQFRLPTQQNYQDFPENVGHLFSRRKRAFNHLRYNTDAQQIPPEAVSEKFSKEHIRVAFNKPFLAEVSNVDGTFWRQQFTYPLEIKEKTSAVDARLGPYFGLDVGPSVKLAHYGTRRGNLRSLLIVREIDDMTSRNLVSWWFITFEDLTNFASWVPKAGGAGMGGGASSVVCIPKSEFKEFTATNLHSL